VVSENQAQLGHEVKAIKAKDRLRDCKDHEEKEGRLNYDMLNHFIVIGGPYIDPGLNQQQALQSQVSFMSVNILSQPFRPYPNITNSFTSPYLNITFSDNRSNLVHSKAHIFQF
jgi:hypothetical protein